MEEVFVETEYKGYYISNFGNLKGRNNKLVKLTVNKCGYCCYAMYPEGRKSKCKCLRIHRLVAKAFIPNPKNLPLVNHKDGNKTNNHIDNLEWCDYSYNSKHAYDNGLTIPVSGCNHPSSKLTIEDIEWIKKHYKPNDREFGTRGLGRMFKVTHSVISELINGKTYKKENLPT